MPEHAASVLAPLLPVLLRNTLLIVQSVLIVTVAVQILLPTALVSGIGVGIGRLMERRHRGNLQRVMLEHLLCPGCGYDLRGLEPRAEGQTGCPECGAAWLVPLGLDGAAATANLSQP